MDVSDCWGNDAVGFGTDDLSVVSPAKECRLINSAWSSRRVWSDPFILTSLPYQRIGVELEAIEMCQHLPGLGVVLWGEPEE